MLWLLSLWSVLLTNNVFLQWPVQPDRVIPVTPFRKVFLDPRSSVFVSATPLCSQLPSSFTGTAHITSHENICDYYSSSCLCWHVFCRLFKQVGIEIWNKCTKLNYISFLLFTWQYFLSLLIYLEYLYLSFNYVILCCIFITIIFPQYKISLPFTLDIYVLFSNMNFFYFTFFYLPQELWRGTDINIFLRGSLKVRSASMIWYTFVMVDNIYPPCHIK